MEAPGWFELRVDGSVGTAGGKTQGASAGLAIGADGRLCSISPGPPMRFKTEDEAMGYLMSNSLGSLYRFVVVPISGK